MFKFKSKTKYTWEGWESNGKEDWVFGVKHPCELMGVHAKLIDKELKADEKIESCLYSPCTSSTSTPFGLVVEESSYGLCVTDKRFIISKDRHVKEIEPAVTSIDFDDVLYFHIGSVLLLSWFSVTYAKDGKANTVPIIFGTNGKHHFEKALRAYKKYCSTINTDESSMDTFWAGSFLHKIKDSIHRSHLKTLISVNEKCILTFSCRYIWEKILYKRSLLKRKDHVAYLTSKATVLLTNKALIIARDGVEHSIGNSVDILNISLDKAKSIILFEESVDSEKIHKLKISFNKEARQHILEIGVTDIDEETKIFLNDVLLLLNLTPSLNAPWHK
jgi:hypothetical protein